MTTELDCSIGLSIPETTYGTPVTVTQFPEFTDESLDWDPTFVQGKGLRVGRRVARSPRRSLGKQQVTGDFTVEAGSRGLGVLLAAAFGNSATAVVSGSANQQTHQPATTDFLDSRTIQKGIPPVGGGTTNAITFPGMMCETIEFSLANSDILMVKTSWVGREARTDIGYAAPSYSTPVELFTFAGGAIAIGGTFTAPTTTALASGGTAVATISDFDLTWDNGLDQAGFNLGGAGKRSRKNAVGLGALTGKLTAEYQDNTLRDAFLNQTDLGLLLTFTGTSIITGAIHPALQIYIPEFRLESELPKANGGDVISQSIDITGLDNLVATAPIQVMYVTADTAIG